MIVYFSAGYANGVTESLMGFALPTWVWWIILYVAFVALNTAGAAISLKFAIVVSFISIGVLVLFGIMALVSGSADFGSLFNIEPDPGQTAFLPHGPLPILFALPFAMWLFLGIEELPLAAEESNDPVRDIPKAGIWARGTLVFTGCLLYTSASWSPAAPTTASLRPSSGQGQRSASGCSGTQRSTKRIAGSSPASCCLLYTSRCV